MDYFKSDFFKVLLLLFIVLFSFTSGCPKEHLAQKALEKCKSGMDIIFGLDTPLLKCVEKAITSYSDKVYIKDVNDYYRTFYNYVTAEHIELPVQFCQGIKRFKKRLYYKIVKPNFEECMYSLESFEDVEPIFKKNIVSIVPFPEVNRKEYERKEKILYNALYIHELGFDSGNPHRHNFGTYGALYLESIANSVFLINVSDMNFTPRKFCHEKHKLKENDDDEDDDNNVDDYYCDDNNDGDGDNDDEGTSLKKKKKLKEHH